MRARSSTSRIASGNTRFASRPNAVPRYQKEMLRYLARQEGTSIGAVLSRELEDMASARAEELAAAVPSVAIALQL